jgi:hypothetical protein
VLADAGYWTNSAIEALAADGLQPPMAPDADRRKEPRPGRRGGPDQGQPPRRPLLRRGRSAVRSEWRLLAATHNLLKLHRHQLATA